MGNTRKATGVTSAKDWKGKRQRDGQDLPLPSGNVARVRQISPVAFLESGFLPDPLTNIVRKAINSKQGLKPTDVNKIADDPKRLVETMEVFDRVLTYCVIEPVIELKPNCIHVALDGEDAGVCGESLAHASHNERDHEHFHKFMEGERDADVLYSDEVDLDDKIFIFQWALGGTSNLENFRDEQRSSMGLVSDRKRPQGAAKRTARAAG